MRTAKILVVDDEPQLRRVMRSALTKQGYIIDDARSGEAALEKIRDERYDLIILDRNMPGMGGVAACRSIREHSDVGIIMLTVRKDEPERIEALDAGADDYVTKPFSMPELLARIRANLRRLPLSPREGAAIVAFGGIEVDLGSRHVSVDKQDVRLTPKQFEVLHYLIANPNVAIPHGKILQVVWGPDYGNEAEYLHVIVNQLRKKIEPDPARPRYILTEPRFGYRFQFPKQ
ncbi:MAG: response regulator transcription factor [Acidobacteriaceae bacterium]|jgi:two-component system KDP operon response regulator KdpE